MRNDFDSEIGTVTVTYERGRPQVFEGVPKRSYNLLAAVVGNSQSPTQKMQTSDGEVAVVLAGIRSTRFAANKPGSEKAKGAS